MKTPSPRESEAAMMGCLVIVLTLPFTLALRGWALSVLWAWFVSPFFGIKPMPIAYALGIAGLVGLLVPTPDCKKDEAEKPAAQATIEALTKAVLGPLLAVFFGWIIRGFLPH